MILQRLVELAKREGLVDDPAFEPGEVSFLIEIDEHGSFRGVQSLLSPRARGNGLVGRSMPLPALGKRTVNVKPRYLVDTTPYVLGADISGEYQHPERIPEMHSQWRELCQTAANETKGTGEPEPALEALVLFLDRESEKQKAVNALTEKQQEFIGGGRVLPKGYLVSFTLSSDAGACVLRRRRVAGWWRASRSAATPKLAGATCIVTGAPADKMTQHPAIKRVPKGKADCALVSFNDSAYTSFGLEGFDNAAMSQAAADGYTRALNRLLHDKFPDPSRPDEFLPKRRVDLCQDTAIVYWASEDDTRIDLFAEVAAPDPVRVQALLTAPLSGRETRMSGDDAVSFYALTLSGAAARVVVRDWFETSVADFAKHVADYFDDIEIDRVPRATLSLTRLLDATAPVLEGRPDRKRLLPSVAARMWQDILRGRPLAPVLLHAVVTRVRAERGVRPEQAALLKAYFNRLARKTLSGGLVPRFPEVTKNMDENNKTPAYLTGRAFAVLEKLQKDAIPGINQTIADRYYGAASATPAMVMATLLRKSRAHIAKASSGRWLEQQLEAIFSDLKGFPTTLGLEEQGLFALGYYHQKNALYAKKDAGSSNNKPEKAPTQETMS